LARTRRGGDAAPVTSYHYRTIKNILRDGLDLTPFATTTTTTLEAPRFARPVSELLHRSKDKDHEHN
jgi:hypothetical protein